MVPVAAATMTPVPLLGALVYYKFRHLWEKKDGEQVGSYSESCISHLPIPAKLKIKIIDKKTFEFEFLSQADEDEDGDEKKQPCKDVEKEAEAADVPQSESSQKLLPISNGSVADQTV